MPFLKVRYNRRHLNLKDKTNRREKQKFPHLFKAIILAQSPAVPITVDRDLHCGGSAHDTVCHDAGRRWRTGKDGQKVEEKLRPMLCKWMARD